MCTCLSTALLIQEHALQGPYSNQPIKEAIEETTRINSWAYAGELCIHGDPSGVDNTVACLGRAVLFHKAIDGNGPSSVKPLEHFPTLRLLLVNTKQPRSTAEQVKKVRQLKSEHPKVVEPILGAIGGITEQALQFLHLAAGHFDSDERRGAAIENLGRLIRINQGLLVSLGVSHPSLDRVSELADAAGLGWTKLTGAGGGGCAIILLRPVTSEDVMKKFEQKIAELGFEKHDAVLGAAGVGIRGRNLAGSGLESQGRDVDEQRFAKVETCDTERLVGLGGRENEGDAWRFWGRERPRRSTW